MKTDNPITKQEYPLTVDNIEMTMECTTYAEPIWKTGQLVYAMAVIRRNDNKQTWGLGYFPEERRIDEDELKEWALRLLESPTAIKLPFV